jgi:hypothetical protein
MEDADGGGPLPNKDDAFGTAEVLTTVGATTVLVAIPTPTGVVTAGDSTNEGDAPNKSAAVAFFVAIPPPTLPAIPALVVLLLP